MDWNLIEQVIKNPLFIVVAAVLIALLVVLFIFATKSVSKGEIKSLKLGIPGLKNGLISLENQIKTVKEEAPKVQKAVIEVGEKFKKEVDVLLARSEYFEHAIFTVLEEIPNEKVKKALETLKAQYKEKQREIKEYVGISVTEIEEQLRQRDLQIAMLSDELSKVKDSLNETLKNAEIGEIAQEVKEYGEREEGTND